MRAVILERNKLVNRRLVRMLNCAGVDAAGVMEPEEAEARLDDAHLLCADAFDGAFIAQAVAKRPNLRALMWTAEPLERCLRYAVEHPQINNVFGRPGFESSPRDWELSMMLRRIARPSDGGPPFASYLNWGFTGFQERIGDTRERDQSTGKAIISSAKDYGADLIVSGAWGHSRMLETVLGGVTRHLLHNLPVPLFIAH